MSRNSLRKGANSLRNSELWHLICDWNLSSVARSVAERMEWPPSFSFQIEYEYRRFLYLVITNPDKRLGMAGPVDELWHGHIVDTVDYAEFCRHVAGRFLHHVPTNGAEKDRAGYMMTLTLLAEQFGDVNPHIWPDVMRAEIQCCSSCSHVSELVALAAA